MPAKLNSLGGVVVATIVAVAAISPRASLASGSAGGAAASPAPVQVAQSAASGPDTLGPDDFALRYYASLNLTNRVNTEINRLQRLYPGFEPPKDLYSAPLSDAVDEGPLWELFGADKLDELRTAIAAREKETVGWKPTADLLRKLHGKEMRERVKSLTRDGHWQDLVELVKTEDMNGMDQDFDLQWAIAEGFARTKQTNDAVAQFMAILTSTKDRKILVATLQKSIGLLRMSDVEKLLAAVSPADDGSLQYLSIMNDITRERIAAFLHDERAEEVPAADVASFEAHARASREPDQMGLIAWYDYKRRDFRNALEWFKSAIENGGDAMVAHGLAHTLRALGKLREAEEVAFAWRTPLVNNSILFIDLLERDLTRETPPFIEADRLARYGRVTMETASGEGAQALAWYAHNSCQFDVALFWFEHAVAWLPKDATVYGYALTLRRLKKDQRFYELANRYDGLDPKLIELLFPDGYYHPPTSCDMKRSAKLHGPGLKTLGYLTPGPAMIPGAAPNYDISAYSSPITEQKNASQPAAGVEPDNVLLTRVLRNLKGKFPVAVAPENPLRFRSTPWLGGRAIFQPPLGPDPSMRPDPGRGPNSLVARRVPGVSVMPYERYGFSLLPGWNGLETATWPPASQQRAVAGTQWANQESDPAALVNPPLLNSQRNLYGGDGSMQVNLPVAAPVPSGQTSVTCSQNLQRMSR
jgi:tetratricopeptide (TPR) repeat protein